MKNIFYKSPQLIVLMDYFVSEAYPEQYISSEDVLHRANQFIQEYLDPSIPTLSESPINGFLNYPALEVFDYTYQKERAIELMDNIILEVESLGVPLSSISDFILISVDGIMCIKYKDELCQQLY